MISLFKVLGDRDMLDVSAPLLVNSTTHTHGPYDMTLTIPLPSPGVRRDDLFTPIAELLPLPQETYPRIFDKRKPDKGYYIALCLILSLWVITPFSWYGTFPSGSDIQLTT
jgi:hypothetical protein